MRTVRRLLAGLGLLALALAAVWSAAIGPTSVWRVITHGTTTVWDHLEYPGRHLVPSTTPQPWPVAAQPLPEVTVDGETVPLEEVLVDRGTLAFVVIRDGVIAHEWYAADHEPNEPSMLFSVTKSVFSLLIGAAIDDGLIASVDDPVTLYLPEMDDGFGSVTIEKLLRMDSGIAYVEDDNPFGIHVEFNYTPELAEAILDLEIREEPDAQFTYKSGDNALFGLVLDQALGDETITGYMQRRLWGPLGAESGGTWSTDHEAGLERTWCCLAVTALDLARLGQLVVNDGVWKGERLLSSRWLAESFAPGFTDDRWPAEYDGSALTNYGYHWWLTTEAVAGIGKDGQYLYVDRSRRVVIVRLGETQGGPGWVDVLSQVSASLG